jgi:hypothetical protein
MRRLLPALLILAVLACGAYAGWWWVAARALEDGVRGWAERVRAGGGQVSYAGLAVDGFPLALRATAAEPRVVRPDGSSWSAPALVASAAPWSPHRIAVAVPGPQRAEMPAHGGRPALSVEAGPAEGAVRLRADGSVAEGRVVVADVAAAARLPGGPETARAATAELALSEAAEGPVVSAALTGIRVPGADALGLGPAAERAHLLARLTAPPPRALTAEALAAWTRAGNEVRIERAGLVWGPAEAVADGVVRLDGALQPAARLTARVTGYQEALDAAAEARAIPPDAARTARTILALMAEPAADGGAPAIRTAVVLQDRWLSVGPIRILRLPPVEWP